MAEPLKDAVDEALVLDLAHRLLVNAPKDCFDRTRFVKSSVPKLDDLELKDRINLLADAIDEMFSCDYLDTLRAVVATSQTGLGSWAGWVLCSFVERHGLDHPDESVAAMETLTTAATCEFAIRPYLENHLDLTRLHLRRWAASPNEQVRRLASEGTRPNLPWGPKVQALNDDPSIGLELLQTLRHDPSETVRRSVANHLNDLAKADPDLVVATLRAWTDESDPVDSRLVRHALRTLVKNGHPGALALLGFTTEPQVRIESFTCNPASVVLGSHIELSAALQSEAQHRQLLVVDFVIHHRNASGGSSPKLFKWTTVPLEPNERVTLTKRRLIQNLSTRTYHPGVHTVDLKVAGRTLASAEFVI